MRQHRPSISILTNMYPSKDDVAWRGVFIKEQVETLREKPNVKIHLFHIKGKLTKGGSNLNYLIWALKSPVLAYYYKINIQHSHHFLTTFIAKIYPFAKVIYTVHEGELDTQKKKAWFIQKAIGWSDYVIYVNEKMYLQSKHENKFFLPSGVNINKFNIIDKLEARNKLNLLVDKFYIFFPASPHRKEKNAQFLHGFQEANLKFMQENGMEIIWGGNIEYEDMNLYMNAADVLVSFSEYESDGMVFKESMACNLPVITFDVGNAPIYFKNHNVGSVIKDDFLALKEELLYWKNKGSSSGRKYLLQLGMDQETVSSQLSEIYNKILT